MSEDCFSVNSVQRWPGSLQFCLALLLCNTLLIASGCSYSDYCFNVPCFYIEYWWSVQGKSAIANAFSLDLHSCILWGLHSLAFWKLWTLFSRVSLFRVLLLTVRNGVNVCGLTAVCQSFTFFFLAVLVLLQWKKNLGITAPQNHEGWKKPQRWSSPIIRGVGPVFSKCRREVKQSSSRQIPELPEN